jgi:hypothetical protein
VALASVQRTPTILGVNAPLIFLNRDGAAWQVYLATAFTNMDGSGLIPTTLRFHTITLTNNGPVAVLVAMDTSTGSTALFSAVNPATAGFTLNVEETLTVDVSTLGAAIGIRRVMLVNDIQYGGVVPYDLPNYTTYAVPKVDIQVGFYTAHQSA